MSGVRLAPTLHGGHQAIPWPWPLPDHKDLSDHWPDLLPQILPVFLFRRHDKEDSQTVNFISFRRDTLVTGHDVFRFSACRDAKGQIEFMPARKGPLSADRADAAKRFG